MTKYLLFTFAILSTSAIIYFAEKSSNLGSEPEPDIVKNRRQYAESIFANPNTGKLEDGDYVASLDFVQKRFGTSVKSKYSNFTQSGISWRKRGPYFIGGRTRALAYDINNEERILAGAVDSGMWISEDGGKTWIQTTDFDESHSVSCIAQDTRPGKTNIWYYGSGEDRVYPTRLGYGISKSTDGGKTWHKLKSTTQGSPNAYDNPFDFVSRIVVDHTNTEQDVLYASTIAGAVHKSTDGGQTWKVVLGGFSSNFSGAVEIAISQSGVLYATFSSQARFRTNTSPTRGIFRSLDGETWTNITPLNYNGSYFRVTFDISQSDEKNLYFFAVTEGSGLLTTNSRGDSLWHSLWKYEYVSGDGSRQGGIWTDLTQNLPFNNIPRMQTNSQSGFCQFIKIHPTVPDVVYLGTVNLYRSKNGFTTPDFQIIGGTCPELSDDDCDYNYRYDGHHADLHELIFSQNNPNVMWTGSDGGVHRNDENLADFINWESLNNGYYTTQFYGIDIDKGTIGDESIVGGMQDNGTMFIGSPQTKGQWNEILRADGFNCQLAKGRKFVITSQNYSYQPMIRIWMSEIDEQGNMLKTRRIDPIGGKNFRWNTPLKLDPVDNNMLYVAGGEDLWVNTDLSGIELPQFDKKIWRAGFNDSISTNWEIRSNEPIGDPGGSIGTISAMGISTIPAHVLYYGTSTGRFYKIDNTKDANSRPKYLTGNGLLTSGNISCIAVNPEDANELLVVYSNFGVQSIYHSKDGGDSFVPSGGNLEEFPSGFGNGPAVLWAEILPLKNGKKVYFAGTIAGLYSTSEIDGVNTVWRAEISKDLGNNYIAMIASRKEDGFVAIGTHATGVYSTYISDYQGSIPESVELLSPLNNQGGITSWVNLQWQAADNEAIYELELYEDNQMQNLVQRVQGISNNFYQLEVIGNSKNYYWRVRAKGSGGFGDYSELWNFKTQIAVPNKLFPSNSSQNIPNEVTFSWEPLESATKYHFQLSDNFSFTNVLDSIELSQTQYTVGNLDLNKRYFWRVKASDEFEYGLWGNPFNFRTRTTVSVANSIHSSLEFVQTKDYILLQNALGENINLQILMFDFNGKQVFCKIDGNSESKKVSLENLPNGVYFLNCRVKDEMIIKKVIVQK